MDSQPEQGLHQTVVTALASVLLLLAGCPMDDDDGSAEEDSSATPVTDTLQGTASKAAGVEISDGQDGAGTLYIAAFAECSLGADLLGAAAVDADLSDPHAAVPFAIDDLPVGAIYLAAFLDDNADADPMAPTPGPGDLVFADGVGDGVLSCVEAEAGDDAVSVVLNAAIPTM